jgi:BirA family biotin operon repressor/biotin-[acetyl-CoA-carboxylase] ligase
VPGLEIHDLVGSTNDRARELAEAGAGPFTVVIAESQTSGRGREGKRWESAAGTGLWFSLVAPPREPAARALIPLRVGLAACRAIEAVAPGVRAGLKWPNDVLIAGRKAAGVLCESTPAATVIGIGVNVRPGGLPLPLARAAIALEDAVDRPVHRGELAGRLLAELRELLAPASLRLEGDVGREVEARDILKGRRVLAATGDAGVARGIGPDGALRLEMASGEVRSVVGGGIWIWKG